MNFTVRLKLLPSEAVYLSVPQMSGCPQMSANSLPGCTLPDKKLLFLGRFWG